MSCSNCGSNKVVYVTKNLCRRCYDKLIHNPKWNPLINKNKILFKGRFILLKSNPRKGKCSNCGKKIGDRYIDFYGNEQIVKGTDMHHKKYDESNPLKYTQELCDSCHNKVRYNVI